MNGLVSDGSSWTRAGVTVAASFVLLCGSAQASSPYRYEVGVYDPLERLAVRACFDWKVPQALVAESDAARHYLESMR